MRNQQTGPLRRQFKVPPAVMVAIVILTACSSGSQGSASPPLNRNEILKTTSGQMTAVLPNADLAVGTNQRFLVAIIGEDNRPITDATVNLDFFKVTGPGTAQLRSTATTTYREAPGLPDRGVYVTRSDFDEAGDWGVAVQITRPNAEPSELRVSFQVKPKSETPAIGSVVPASRTLTGTNPAEIEKFSSARPPDPALYQVSIADALGQRKPFAVLFATPGFCTSRTCGPSLDVLQALQQQYGDRANFIHVEIYQNGQPPDVVPVVKEWGLPSEPWLFVVDADGRVADKFEGSITVDEVGPAVAAVTNERSRGGEQRL